MQNPSNNLRQGSRLLSSKWRQMSVFLRGCLKDLIAAAKVVWSVLTLSLHPAYCIRFGVYHIQALPCRVLMRAGEVNVRITN